MRKDIEAIYGHLTDSEIMALTIWAESRGEPLAGKIAVGTVILNRVEHRAWDGKTVKEVCLWPRQFSCFNDYDPQHGRIVKIASDFQSAMENDKRLADCYLIATGLLKNILRPDEDIVKSKCCQYLTTAAKDHCNWWQKMRFVKKIGAHEFYTDLA